jgi:hypothetical protein
VKSTDTKIFHYSIFTRGKKNERKEGIVEESCKYLKCKIWDKGRDMVYENA